MAQTFCWRQSELTVIIKDRRKNGTAYGFRILFSAIRNKFTFKHWGAARSSRTAPQLAWLVRHTLQDPWPEAPRLQVPWPTRSSAGPTSPTVKDEHGSGGELKILTNTMALDDFCSDHEFNISVVSKSILRLADPCAENISLHC